MIEIKMTIEGIDPGFEDLLGMTRIMALRGNRETMLVAWSDRKQNKHSPCCIRCQIGDEPGWEVYGRNHEGRLRISVNRDDYVFIYT